MTEQTLKQSLKKKANSLPKTPGVYIMKDKNGKIIYIGKAKALKNRVTQYFGSDANHNTKVRKMVNNVEDFDYILCDNEEEALILENSLIKQNQPKYNILLKDDKGFHFVKITDEKWKRLLWVKQKTDDGKYIGPYHSGAVVKRAVDEALKIFKLPQCNRSFEKKSKPCLNYHIGLCCAPCTGKVKIEEYLESVSSAISFIKKGGYRQEDIGILKEKMEKAADNLDFEYAAKLRDRIDAVEKMRQKQKVISSTHKNQDVIATVISGTLLCVEILKFRDYLLTDEEHHIFDLLGTKAQFYDEFIVRYYSSKDDIPSEILIDILPESAQAIENWISEKGLKTKLITPKIGTQLALLNLCTKNAAENLAKRMERSGNQTAAINELAQLLGMEKGPEYIESYDISNISGSENVGAMVVFSGGNPLKSNYRKFKIKSFIGQDDYRSMAEVLDRRFIEYKKGEDPAFSVLPDLILIDGGKGQVNAVLPILKKHSLSIPVFGMVKDSKHRTNAIASFGEIISLKSIKGAFNLITKIQDETHRFAITFHKKRRSKGMTETVLTTIDGVGEKRAKILFKHFKTLKAIKSAKMEDIASVKGIDKKTAQNIYGFFNNQ